MSSSIDSKPLLNKQNRHNMSSENNHDNNETGGFILPSATAEILDATSVPIFLTHDEHETNLHNQFLSSQQSNHRNSDSSDVLTDEQGRRYEIVGDPVNHRGVFIKHILGDGWAPCGTDRCYSCIFPVMAPSHFCCLFLCVTGLCVVFSLFVVPKNEVWSITVMSIIWCVTLLVMWKGTSTDPGIILPARHGDIFYPDGEKDVLVSDEIGKVDLKPCPYCKITRPYRVSHCGTNGYCVAEADHMCGVLGINVAKRTMRYFVGSIYGLMALAVFCAIRSLVLLLTGANENGTLGVIFGWFFVLVGAMMICCLGAFAGMHSYNACLGRNERDAVRSRKDEEHGHRAYGKHGKYECSFSNFWEAFCGDNGESALATLNEEDLKML